MIKTEDVLDKLELTFLRTCKICLGVIDSNFLG
jgi:hypothetical protein